MTIIKLPSGINPVVVPVDQQTEEIKIPFWDLDTEDSSNGRHNRGGCKHDLRTSFLEREIVFYCTKCDYKIRGAKVHGK